MYCRGYGVFMDRIEREREIRRGREGKKKSDNKQRKKRETVESE